jgi:TPR repeat protein
LLVSDFAEIRRAADLGDAFAQAWMAWRTDREERFRWSEKSAERGAFFWLGHCYRGGIGCVQVLERTKECFLISAELGDVHAMEQLGELLDKRILNDLFGSEELP